MVSILSLLPQIIVVRVNTRTNGAKYTIITFILFASIKLNTIAFTSTINTTIMSIVAIVIISIVVAITMTLTSIIVFIHIIMIGTIVAIIVTL